MTANEFSKLTGLKALYNKSLRVRSAVPHPRIMGIIRECGGKMHMNEGEYLVPLILAASISNYFLRKLEGCPERFLRVIPQLRRGRVIAKNPGPQVPCFGEHAHEVRD